MPKSKNRKNHKSKVRARNLKIKASKNRAMNIQKEYFTKLIEEEKKKGLYKDTTPINSDNIIIDSVNPDGPIIDPMDGPSI